MAKKTKFIIAVALQTAIILVIIVFKMSILIGGTEIMLEIKPVDPRDYLRGDYVTFQYDISDFAGYYYASNKFINGDTIYVVLGKYKEYWEIRDVQKNKPADKEVFIKGKVESGGYEKSGSINNKNTRDGYLDLRIVYGIEQYFIPEGTGMNFNFGNKQAAAKVMVNSDGNAVIKQIYLDKKLWP